MGLVPITTTTKEGGKEKDSLVVTFTNGAKKQIEELQKFINAEDPLEVIKLGIAFVQRAKELDKKKSNVKL